MQTCRSSFDAAVVAIVRFTLKHAFADRFEPFSVPTCGHRLQSLPFCFDRLRDAGDDAPCQKRQNNFTTSSIRMLRTTLTHCKFLSLKFLQRRHTPPSVLLKLNTTKRHNRMKESPYPKATMFKLSQNSIEPDEPTQINRARRSRSFFLYFLSPHPSFVTARPR